MIKVHVYGEGHLADATREVVSLKDNLELVEASECDIWWCCIDMPILENDTPNMDLFYRKFQTATLNVKTNSLILISTQLPVGTTEKLEFAYSEYRFAVQPENIRKAQAVADLNRQNRIVVGTRHMGIHERVVIAPGQTYPSIADLHGSTDVALLSILFRNFTPGHIYFMSPESAEMTKHALNGFLATCINYANEIAELCEQVDANIGDVIAGFTSDIRIGNEPLVPGKGYSGGTLGRDVAVINEYKVGPLLRSLRESNQRWL